MLKLLLILGALLLVSCFEKDPVSETESQRGSLYGKILKKGGDNYSDTVKVNLFKESSSNAALKTSIADSILVESITTSSSDYEFDSLSEGTYYLEIIKDEIAIGEELNIQLEKGEEKEINITVFIIINQYFNIVVDSSVNIIINNFYVQNGNVTSEDNTDYKFSFYDEGEGSAEILVEINKDGKIDTVKAELKLNDNGTYSLSGLDSSFQVISASADPPEIPVLNDSIEVLDRSITLLWDANNESNFKSYKIYYDTIFDVTSNSPLFIEITDPNTISMAVDSLLENTQYWFAVITENTDGKKSISKIITATTNNTLPDPVNLDSVKNVTDSSFTLSWDKTSTADFKSYDIYYSTDSTDTSLTLHTKITDIDSLSLVISGLEENSTYYYRIYVVDTDTSIVSNIVYVQTLNTPPIASSLSLPTAITDSSMTLNWSKTDTEDFKSYQVYYSKDSSVDTNDSLSGELTNLNDTTITVSGLDENTRYYFKVFVFDSLDNVSSNEISDITLNKIPGSIILSSATSITDSSMRLEWSKTDAADFKSYQLYFSKNADVDTSGSPGSLLNDVNDTTTTVNGLDKNTIYYFKVFVFDSLDYIGSNEINAKTLNTTLAAATNLQSSAITDSSFTLSWNAMPPSNFESYKIYYSTSPTVTLTNTLAATITDSNTKTYDFSNLSENTNYYVKVFVFNASDNIESSEITLKTLNNLPGPASRIVISNVVDTGFTLIWSANPPSDFTSYKVYYSTSPSVTTSSNLATTITDPDTKSYEFSNLNENTLYYFRVFVFDSVDNVGSSEIELTTLEPSPPASVIFELNDTVTNFYNKVFMESAPGPGLISITLSTSDLGMAKIGLAVMDYTRKDSAIGGVITKNNDSNTQSLTTRFYDGKDYKSFNMNVWDVLGQTFGEDAIFNLRVLHEPLHPSVYSSEPKNNTLVGSDGIELNVNHKGFHTADSNEHLEGYAGDRDWYSFIITEPGYLDVVVAGADIGPESRLFLYDVNGTEIYKDNGAQIGPFFGSSQQPNILRSNEIYLDNTKLGTYHILVYNDENAFADSWKTPNLGSYTVNPTFVPRVKTLSSN